MGGCRMGVCVLVGRLDFLERLGLIGTFRDDLRCFDTLLYFCLLSPLRLKSRGFRCVVVICR
jgi:hypothetical protein